MEVIVIGSCVVPLPYTGNQSNKSNNKDVQVQNGLSHPLGPFRGNAGGMGAFGGPFLPRGRAGFLAISGHKPMGTKADQDQQDQDQHGPRGRARFPRQADQDQYGPRGRALFPRQTRTST